MELTVLGYIIIPISLITILKNYKLLLYMGIFFLPFTASSIINIKSITFGLMPSYYLFLIWMVVKSYIYLRNPGKIIKKINNIKINYKYQYNVMIVIMAFLIIAIISQLMIFKLNGEVLVHYPDSGYTYSELVFRRTNITQLLYLAFVIIFTIFIILEDFSFTEVNRIVYIILGSTLFTNLWGFFQVICKKLHIHYPWEIFNNSMSFKYAKYIQTIRGIPRISSVAPEPSMYSFYLLIVFAIMAGMIIENYPINKKFLFINFIITFITLILTFSSSSYMGIIFICFIFLLIKLLNKNKSFLFPRKFKATIIIIIIIILLTIVFNKDIQNVVYNVTFGKLHTTSGHDRLDALIKSLKIFLVSPILGVGWGSNRSFDLISTLLSTVGLTGTICFLSIFYLTFKIILDYKNDIKYLSMSMFTYLSVSLFVFMISIPDIVFLYFWFLLGFSVSLQRTNHLDINNNK